MRIKSNNAQTKLSPRHELNLSWLNSWGTHRARLCNTVKVETWVFTFRETLFDREGLDSGFSFKAESIPKI